MKLRRNSILAVCDCAVVLISANAHAQNLEFGPFGYHNIPNAINGTYPWGMTPAYPSKNPPPVDYGYYIRYRQAYGVINPGDASATSEMVRAVLIGRSPTTFKYDRIYVLSDMYLSTGTSPQVQRRDYRLSRIKLTDSNGNASPPTEKLRIVDFRDPSHHGGTYVFPNFCIHDSNPDPDNQAHGVQPDTTLWDDEHLQELYQSDGADRLGGGCIDPATNTIYTVGMCNMTDGGSTNIHNRSFVISKFIDSDGGANDFWTDGFVPSVDLAHDASTPPVHPTNLIVNSGSYGAEGNAIAFDSGRLYAAGAISNADGTRDFYVAVADPLTMTTLATYTLSRAGDDVACWVGAVNMGTTTRIYVSGHTDTGPNGAGPLTMMLTYNNSTHALTKNWVAAPPNTQINALSAAGLSVSPDGSGAYTLATESDVPGDVWSYGFYYNYAHTDGNNVPDGVIGPLDKEHLGGGGTILNGETLIDCWQMDGLGTPWYTYSPLIEHPAPPGSNETIWSYDIRFREGIYDLGGPYDSGGTNADLGFFGILDPRYSGGSSPVFYAGGWTLSPVNAMHFGNMGPSFYNYPTISGVSPGFHPDSLQTFPLSGTGVPAIRAGETGSYYYAYRSGGNPVQYPGIMVVARPNRAADDTWEDGSLGSSLRKYRYHGVELTIFGIN